MFHKLDKYKHAKKQTKQINIICILLGVMFFSACQAQSTENGNASADSTVTRDAQTEQITLSFDQMNWEKDKGITYATQFYVETCEDYALITIVEDGRFLLIPENAQIPEHLPEDVKVLKQPLDHTYIASSSVFDLVREAGALDQIRFSGTKKEDLCIEEAVEAMEDGRMLYAGKYSKPDYELLISENCKLAIENTMIYHNPETKEKLESLGIPVLVETSSYEKHPYGRMEWIKLYGYLFDEKETVNTFFEKEVEKLSKIIDQNANDESPVIAFFYVNTNGVINVRKPGDYVTEMISMAGGTYALNDAVVEEDNALSTMNMQMEDFYLAAKDADILIYNSTITGELTGVEDLLDKNPVFADFKAVKEDRLYCTEKNFFQETTAIGDFVLDLSEAMTDPDKQDFRQMKKVGK